MIKVSRFFFKKYFIRLKIYFQNAMDKKLGGPFNVVVGEAFSIDVDYLNESFFYMIFGGYLGIFVWKCV